MLKNSSQKMISSWSGVSYTSIYRFTTVLFLVFMTMSGYWTILIFQNFRKKPRKDSIICNKIFFRIFKFFRVWHLARVAQFPAGFMESLLPCFILDIFSLVVWFLCCWKDQEKLKYVRICNAAINEHKILWEKLNYSCKKHWPMRRLQKLLTQRSKRM